jgi:putative ubiquitin-RnfH superfamily antitoxin RatB of RatAB toxin-antitoxin module
MSERARQALGSIEDGLAGSEPALSSMLGIFSRLTSGEEMSAREKIEVRRRAVQSPRRARRRPHHGTALRRAHQLYLRVG